MIHAFQLLFIDCNYPKAFVWWIGLHAVMFYFLFSDFYKQAYNKKGQRRVRSTRMGIASALFYLGICTRGSLQYFENLDSADLCHPVCYAAVVVCAVRRCANSGFSC
jgi:hypothetical protein